MSKILLSMCLLFLTTASANAEDDAAVMRQAVRAGAAGDAALKTPGNSEKSTVLNRSWTTGEQPGFPLMEASADRDSQVLVNSSRPVKPADLTRDPVLSAAPFTDIEPMPVLATPKEELIARMIESDHALSDKERSVLTKTLGEYRLEALQRLYDSGFRVMVTDDYKDFPRHWYGTASAYYTGGEKPRVFMRKDYLEGTLFTTVRTAAKNTASWLLGEVAWGGSRETLMHEMGHAWDNQMIKGGEGADPGIRELYKNYQDTSNTQWSSYADSQGNTAEYLAEGYRMFGQSAEARKILELKDPELYNWMKVRASALYGA